MFIVCHCSFLCVFDYQVVFCGGSFLIQVISNQNSEPFALKINMQAVKTLARKFIFFNSNIWFRSSFIICGSS